MKPLPFRSVPAATHRWRTDGLACPTVTADAARAVGVAGPGRLTESTDLSAAGNTITCLWAPAGRAESVTLSLDTSTSQAAADIAWQTRSALLREAVPGVGEQAFTGVLGNEIQVLVRSGNATLNVTVVAKPDDPEGLSSLRAAAPAIAGAMLGSLIPA
ncbi:hypothetical protein [Actinoplanes sp. G11-F43]|uniref:hypothetical protein n=1 Tax=Actinoplanes sp. G11-F43 TaxID=3424130 RepID=UPI003D341866